MDKPKHPLVIRPWTLPKKHKAKSSMPHLKNRGQKWREPRGC